MPTYNNLRNEVSLMINRGDAHQQTSEIDGQNVDFLNIFIRDAERKLYRDEVTRTPEFEFRQQHTLMPGDNSFPVPLGYLETRYAEATQNNVRRLLNRTSVDQILNVNDITDRVDIVDEFAYGSNTFYIRPASRTVDIDFYYYGELTPVADVTDMDAPNHTLLNQYRDLLRLEAAIKGAMYYGSAELQQMIQLWQLEAKSIRDEIVSLNRRARRSGGSMNVGRHYRNPRRISPNRGSFA